MGQLLNTIDYWCVGRCRIGWGWTL